MLSSDHLCFDFVSETVSLLAIFLVNVNSNVLKGLQILLMKDCCFLDYLESGISGRDQTQTIPCSDSVSVMCVEFISIRLVL